VDVLLEELLVELLVLLDVLVLVLDDVLVDVLVLVELVDEDVLVEVVLTVDVLVDVDVEVLVVVTVLVVEDVVVEVVVEELVEDDELVDDVVEVVVGDGGQPSAVILDIFHNLSNEFLLTPSGPYCTQYRSPPPPKRRTMKPSVPGFGGTTLIVPFLPSSFALMVNTLVGVRRIVTPRTGPCSPLVSVYLNPNGPRSFQNARPELLRPWGSGKSCCVGLPPLAMMVSVAPNVVGSPTRVLPLPVSRALPVILRLAGSLG
jgi:hypothetical protein